MKKILLLLFFILIISCEKEPVYNNFDEIIHYKITNKKAYKVDTIKRFQNIFTSVKSQKVDFNKFEKELLDFGYLKNDLKKDKIKKVDSFISNKIYYGGHLVACVPYYRDILILKKEKKTVGILKICFDCSMIELNGKIETNFNEKELKGDDYFNNFGKLHKILTNKDFKRLSYLNPKDSLNIIQQKLKSSTKKSGYFPPKN